MRPLSSGTELTESVSQDSIFALNETVSSARTILHKGEKSGEITHDQSSGHLDKDIEEPEADLPGQMANDLVGYSPSGEAMDSWRSFKAKYFDKNSFIEEGIS